MSSSSRLEGTFAVIIVAAGTGTRFGRPKHALDLLGKPVWQWSVDVFTDCGAAEVVVVGDVPGGVPGGERRRDSVRCGLDALTTNAPIVLVHDAARPLIGEELVRSVIAAVSDSGADGAIPATPVTDTIKRTEGHRIIETVDRDGLMVVQTPQAFRTDTLSNAHDGFPDSDATDDAALVERAGGTVVVVDGDRMNLKITYPEDVAIAASIVQGRAE